ncbi:MAG: beta-hydroxyacyl-ACP dehydratase [Synergistaceae bacterium]|jgi:3-hydroxyacyl-[acyl-carrier-protein] dehydratase|nr:beta-hydroxyacyl-ACP dehydratase [Synergistaceae bacterium]
MFKIRGKVHPIMILDKDGVMKMLPHRGAMLMVDGILELEYGRRALGYRDVVGDEFWCAGHFPGVPVFPGVLIIEMMAQVCAFLLCGKEALGEEPEEEPAEPERIQHRGLQNVKLRLAKVEEVKFLSEVSVGARLLAEALVDAEGAGFVRARCNATSDGRIVAKGKLTCAGKTA